MSIVSVVIVTFNSKAFIQRLLDCLLSQTYQPNYIVIIDNHSTDNTCELIKNYNNPIIKLVELHNNLGGAGGFAKGLKEAIHLNSDFIFSFDDDAYPKDNDFIEKMLSFKTNHNLDVVAPLVVDTHNHDKTAYEYLVDNQKSSDVNSIQKHEKIDELKLFNGVLFDKKVLLKLKGPRPEFFIRGDEEEFRQRIVRAGFKFATFTEQIVYHPSSVDEYYYIKGKRYHHIKNTFKLFYSTRNRFYMLKLREDFTLRKKITVAFKEFWRYSWFYLIYQKNIQHYYVWLKAFIFGLLGYVKNQKQ
ncbi:glycosyltransferase [Faucicola boevrei]|uniref:glycosyltransferase n=1 Tax=Faucicola boevrei TaxID=346665 RepID=UPI000376BDF0|nr:glycosyltransferase [Moraxella boevrei]